MADKETVRALYPDATAYHDHPPEGARRYLPATWQHPRWSISVYPQLGARELGQGDTEAAAWADAASKLVGG